MKFMDLKLGSCFILASHVDTEQIRIKEEKKGKQVKCISVFQKVKIKKRNGKFEIAVMFMPLHSVSVMDNIKDDTEVYFLNFGGFVRD